MYLFYTALIGDSRDVIRPAPALPDVKFVALLDKHQDIPGWEVRVVGPSDADDVADPRRQARWWKTHPERVDPQAQASVWLDAAMEPTVDDPAVLAHLLQVSDEVPIATFRHTERTCFIQEAQECVRRRKDDSELLRQQLQAYVAAGLPAFLGLAETGAVVRKHNAAMAEFNQLWWAQIASYSCRDQVSFPFVSWRLGVKWRRLPGSCYHNPFFKLHPHWK